MTSTSKDDPSIHALLQTLILELSAEHSKAAARHGSVIKLFDEVLQRPGVGEVSVRPCFEHLSNASSDFASEQPALEEDHASPGQDISGNKAVARLHDEQDMKIMKQQLEKTYTNHRLQTWDDVATLPGWSGCQARAVFIVTSEAFETCIAFLIVLNAFFMAWEIQHQGYQLGYKLGYDGYSRAADEILPQAKSIFEMADWFFGTAFLIELFIKMSIMTRQYFFQFMNFVDSLCVLAFVVDKIAETLLPVSSQVIRLLRLFRLVRLFRLIRRLENLETLYTMTTAIRGTFSILFWSVTLLTFILMACALFLSESLHATYFDRVIHEEPSIRVSQETIDMFLYFGTFTRCLFSMFELTLANWPPIARLLTEEISHVFQLICVFHKIIIGFAVVGVINGVVVKETFKVADTDDVIMVRAKRRDKASIREKLTTFFSAVDFDKSNDIDMEEFYAVAESPEVQLWLNSLGIETDDFMAIFQIFDRDHNGRVDLDELSTILPRIRGTARGIDVVSMAAHLTTQWNKHVKPTVVQQKGQSRAAGKRQAEWKL